jgi:putative ABC transport system permease protein
VTNILKYFLVGIAAISLLVGGIGIMNIMLISVNQRIREVGLRKALGARGAHIIMQFLVESIFITAIGGFLGILLGILISFLASVVINSFGYSWEFIISPGSILVATSISVVIGVIFGLYPARKASRISPIEALRYE